MQGKNIPNMNFLKNATCILTNRSGYMALKVKVICISIIQRTCNVDLIFYNHLETAPYKSEIMQHIFKGTTICDMKKQYDINCDDHNFLKS